MLSQKSGREQRPWESVPISAASSLYKAPPGSAGQGSLLSCWGIPGGGGAVSRGGLGTAGILIAAAALLPLLSPATAPRRRKGAPRAPTRTSCASPAPIARLQHQGDGKELREPVPRTLRFSRSLALCCTSRRARKHPRGARKHPRGARKHPRGARKHPRGARKEHPALLPAPIARRHRPPPLPPAPHPCGFSGVKMSAEEILVCPVKLGENFCLYFDDDDELECDALCKDKTLQRVLRNVNSQLLVVRPDLNVAAFEDVTDQEMQSGKGMHFSIHIYKTTTPLAGLPVAFSVQVGGKNYYMCCERECGEMIVRFKEGEVPKEIPDESNIIFFKRTFTSCCSKAFKFEYSMEQGMFLAFEEEGCLRKLILKKLLKDEVDETTKISLSKFSQNENNNL